IVNSWATGFGFTVNAKVALSLHLSLSLFLSLSFPLSLSLSVSLCLSSGQSFTGGFVIVIVAIIDLPALPLPFFSVNACATKVFLPGFRFLMVFLLPRKYGGDFVPFSFFPSILNTTLPT